MFFTLVKNELIKLFSRGKTWIVFGLFALIVIGTNVAFHFSDKEMRYYNSPQGRIEDIDRNIGYMKESIERYEKELKSNPESNVKEYIAMEKENIKELEKDKKREEEKLKNGVNPNQWKEDLSTEKNQLKERLKEKDVEDREKATIKNRLAEIENIEKLGMKPIESWEFSPFNNSISFMTLIGTMILVTGIAIFMSDIVSGESTPPTLKFLLVQPISRTKVIASKFTAVVLTVLSMIVGLEILAFGALGAMKGFDSGKMPVFLGQKYVLNVTQNSYGWKELVPVENSAYLSNISSYFLQSLGLQILFIIACCSFVFLISTLFKSSMITMAVAVIVSVATTMLTMNIGKLKDIAHLIFLNYGATPSIVNGEIAYMSQNTNFSVSLGVTLMVITIIICPLLAALVFKKKDILI
ncbi:ABC transporter permease [Clostridium sp.]|uniref:ABC transporter permease n=1 Tax=Clostridium sp. TaxID=1506 RepID=UPI0039920949